MTRDDDSPSAGAASPAPDTDPTVVDLASPARRLDGDEVTRPLDELPRSQATPALYPAEVSELDASDYASALGDADPEDDYDSSDDIDAPGPGRRRRSWSPTWLIGRLLIAVIAIVLAVCVAIAGDSAARLTAEHQIEAQLKTQLGAGSRPKVLIGGTPFVTQVMNHSYPQVRLSAPGASVQGLDFTRFDMNVLGLETSENNTQGTIARLTGTVQITYASLGAKQDIELSYVSPTQLKAIVPTTVLGKQVKVEAVGRPELDVAAQTVTFQDVHTKVVGINLPDFITRQLLTSFGVKPVPIPMPERMKVSSIQLDPGGLIADVEGDKVELAALRR